MTTDTETGADIELPKYKCHKEVWALKIKSVTVNDNGSVDIFFEDEKYASKNVEGDSASRFSKPSEDPGYYVVYEGGYASWSPTEAFEKGYTLIE